MESAVLVNEVDLLWGALRVAKIPLIPGLWGEEGREDDPDKEHKKKDAADDRQLVAPELPPHEMEGAV